MKKNEGKNELLSLFIQNQRTAFLLPICAGIIFLIYYLYAYGYPAKNDQNFIYCLLAVAGFFLFRQFRLLRAKIIKSQNFFRYNFFINKIGYTAPYLFVLFWPLKTEYLFDHIAGYIFIILSIGYSIVSNAADIVIFYLSLFLYVAFACLIVILNLNSVDSPYIAITILTFALFSGVIGHRLCKTTTLLIQRNKDLEKATQAKSEFFSVMSHEIRTPLNGIISTLEYIKAKNKNKHIEESLETIFSCSDTLLNTLNDILDIGQVEAGKIQLEERSVNLSKLISLTCNIMRPAAKEKNIIISHDIDKNLPKNLYLDENRMRQILINLISNAVKFTNDGKIAIKASLSNNNLKIEVIDTGIGISDENAKTLFQRFSQADITIARQYGGSGLGLSIVDELIRLMDGQINLETKEGEGSNFWFTIPIKEAEINNIEEPAHSENFLSSNILLIDDNKINRTSASSLLDLLGCTVKTASNSLEALKYSSKQKFDLILMDLNMPIINGLDTTKLLKNNGLNKNTPIVALTATADHDMIEKCYEVGMINSLIKPFKKEDLKDILSQHTATSIDEIKPNKAQSDKIESLIDDFGVDYSCSFFEECQIEINRLIEEIEQNFYKNNITSIKDYAHDIYSIAGQSGFDEASDIAKKLENIENDISPYKLASVIFSLYSTFFTFSNDLKNSYFSDV